METPGVVPADCNLFKAEMVETLEASLAEVPASRCITSDHNPLQAKRSLVGMVL